MKVLIHIVFTQAGVLHYQETVSAGLDGSEASASKRVGKATSLHHWMHLMLLKIVNSWVILVHPRLDIFIELYNCIPLALHLK